MLCDSIPCDNRPALTRFFFLCSHSHFGSHPTFIPEQIAPLLSFSYENPFCNPLVFRFMQEWAPSDMPTFEPASVPRCVGAIPFPFTLLRTLWHAPKLNSFIFNRFRTLCAKTPGGRVSMLNSPSCAPCSQCLSGKPCCVLLGLRWRIRGRLSRPLGLCDRGEGLHVEFLVVRVVRHHAGFASFLQQEAHPNVRLHIRRQPHFVIHEPLFVNEAGSFLKVRQQAAGKFHVPGEIRLQPGHVVRFFVYPDDSGEFLCQFFHQLVRLELGIGLEVENQHVLPAKALAARIHELACTQENLNPRFVAFFVVAFFVLPFFLGLLFFRFFLGRALLLFLDVLLRFLVFLFLFRFAQRLAVFFHQRGDFVPIEI